MTRQRRGSIILCGGKSTRMGRDKATLPFGPGEVMLQRVVRIVSDVVERSQIVVVAAEGQKLPELPPEVQITRDRRPERGPLEGLAAGLTALRDRADAVYATSCDVPLLVPAFVERMFELIADSSVVRGQWSVVTPDRATDHGQLTTDHSSHSALRTPHSELEIVVPRDGKYHHPLAAVYRTTVLPAIEDLLAADRQRPVYLFENCRTLEVPVDTLRDVDPELRSLMNCNRTEDYEAALAVAGTVSTS